MLVHAQALKSKMINIQKIIIMRENTRYLLCRTLHCTMIKKQNKHGLTMESVGGVMEQETVGCRETRHRGITCVRGETLLSLQEGKKQLLQQLS